MDPVTHILLGASLSYAALGRRLGRSAALGGGLAAFAPDADVFIRSATDPLLAIDYHRGFTHALAFAPVGAAIVAALWLVRPAWRNPSRWFTLWSGCLLAYVSHSLLDASTTYGTQLLWPFSSHRAGWDVIAIIDPLFTLVLATGLIWALVRRRARPTVVALGLCAAYIMAGSAQHARAMSGQRRLASARGHTPARAEMMPTLANNIVWRGLYLYDGQIFSDRIRVGWFSAATYREGRSQPLVREADLSAAEKAHNVRRSFQRFAWFSDHWVARSPADRTILADMRYSLSAEAFDPIWGIRLGGSGAEPVEWVNRSASREVRVGELWAEIVGGDTRFRALP